MSAVLAANYALGGERFKSCFSFFNTLAKQGRLVNNDVSIANLEKGEVEVGLV